MPFRPVSALAALGLATAASQAQAPRSAGVSGGILPEGVQVTYVREHVNHGSARADRLVAAVLWSGPMASHSASEGPQALALVDSAAAAARARGNEAGGSLGPRGNAWVEYDPKARVVLLAGHRLTVPTGDSALVVLVDRRDAAGGSAQVTTRTLPATSVAQSPTPRAANRAAAIRHHFESTTAEWERLMRSDERVRVFLASARQR